MTNSAERRIYFSFFMFTVDLRPDDREYTKQIVAHIKELQGLGYTGFDFPIAPTDAFDHAQEVRSYQNLRRALDDAGLGDVGVTTNALATRTFDPSSPYEQQREIALAYLKSRVDITKALRGDIMAGALALPWGVFPTTDAGQSIWSDALQDWLVARYRNAQPVFEELGEYAQQQGVKVAIEPVDHWETPAPNLVSDVVRFLDGVAASQIGLCVDSAHVVLGSDGRSVFTSDIKRMTTEGRLHSVHISAPDRGAVHDSWIPWQPFLGSVLEGYDGPLLIEVFNAIPALQSPLRLTRRKFAIPGEDASEPGRPDAYDIAREAIATVRHEIQASR